MLIAAVAVLAALCAIESRAQSTEVLLTPPRIKWISSQCEAIVGEIEAIIQQNVDLQFNIGSNLRYIALYDSLRLVASKRIPELEWVYSKLRAYGSQNVYQSVINVITTHLQDLDARMAKIEAQEPMGETPPPSKEWMDTYETVVYILSNSAPDSPLEKLALEIVRKSPNRTKERVRATRAKISKHRFL